MGWIGLVLIFLTHYGGLGQKISLTRPMHTPTSFIIKQGKSYVNRIVLVGLAINKTKRTMLIVFDRSASGQEAYSLKMIPGH